MVLNTFRLIRQNMTVAASATALLAMLLLAPRTFAQTGATTATAEKPTWPTTLTLGFGGAANGNLQASGTYATNDPLDSFKTLGYSQSHFFTSPEFHILAEIPIAENWMFAPRIAYNDYSMRWDSASQGVGAKGNNGLAVSQAVIGADLLFKYAFSNFHLMAGPNLSIPIHSPYYAHSQSVSDASNHNTPNSGTVPDYSTFLVSLKGGLGYDIPLNSSNTIWLTPEAFLTYNLTDYVQQPNPPGMTLFPFTMSAGASLKFALAGPPPPPPPAVSVVVKITAHGVMADGSLTPDPVVPQQALHTRSSVPLLPYIFFDDNSSAISTRYSRSGATGYSSQTALNGKNALEANHELLDITGERLKNNPSWKVQLVGTNANAKDEKNNIALSKARATAVADYLINTWGIDRSRITIDQRNLPELPTNPVTKAGMQENRRVEIRSTNADLTAPVKIEDRQALSVGATEVRYDISLTPDPATHHYKSWAITLDKDGTTIGTPIAGLGAPPASETTSIPDAGKYLNQPIHYTVVVTDEDGQTTKGEGLTRVVAKTVDRDNLEKFAMLSFDFDRADINQRARQMLQLISESISRDATSVKIDGFCDQTGSADYNQSLSEARANTAITTLRSMTSLPANVTVHGHGFRDLRFDNELPEGRQLDRRVEITIDKSTH